jgi:hypothetical protein
LCNLSAKFCRPSLTIIEASLRRNVAIFMYHLL